MVQPLATLALGIDDEAARLEKLRSYRILDTLPEPEFDRITALAAELLGVPIALVSLVDSSRQWFKSRHGLEACETPREQAFCAHAINHDQVMVVEDATQDVRFSANPLVTGEPHVRFYAGAPLRTADGFRLGTLCVIDRAPRRIGARERSILSSLAEMVVDAMERHRQSLTMQVELLDKLKIVTDSLDDVFWLRTPGFGRVVYVSPSYERLMGRSCATLYEDPRAFLELVHPGDRARVLRSLARCGETDWELRYRVVRDDGGERFIWERGRALRDSNGEIKYLAGSLADVSREHDFAQDRDRLQRTLDFTQGILDASVDGILAVEAVRAVGGEIHDFEVIEANERAAQLVKRDRDSLIGAWMLQSFPAAVSAGLFDRYKAVVESGRSDRFEVAHTEDGVESWFRVSAVKTGDGMTLTLSDITDLIATQDRLRSSNRMLERFVAAASHDLRSPIGHAAILLSGIARRGGVVGKDNQESLLLVRRALQRADELLVGLLDYTRSTQGEAAFEAFPLSEAVDFALENLRHEIEQSGAQVTCEALPEVRGERTLLGQVFQNLIANAIRYSSEAAPRIEIEAAPDEAEAAWRISVTDNGRGIDLGHAERIFEFMVRLSGESEGTGIGLSLCKDLIERHGGRIWLDTAYRGGSRFSFTLPFAG